MQQISTSCVIAGGGPAGMMLGYLLARAGVDVTVLEKHEDFLRDFRGDTVHPSTLQVMHELGLLEKFLALMPQWDFLDFLAGEAKAFPNFHLLMQTAAEDLLTQDGTVIGTVATGPDGPVEIRAGLTVAADGRHS